jgi:hypothetical protein
MRYLFPEPAPYEDDPVGWCVERSGAYIWSKQREVCESVVANRYTAVKACHGPGKSFIAGKIGCWWIDGHKLGDAFLVTTAPSWPQVQAILWREIRRTHHYAKLQGRITLDCQWYLNEVGNSYEELIAMGRKPADYDETAFQGLHQKYILIILDEAGGIPETLWTAVLTLMTNDNARVLAIGNPDDPGSHFARICKPGSGWNVITIGAFDTPNFTGEYVPDEVAVDLVTPGWVEDRRRDWGEGSLLWQSKVLGEFPDVSDEYLITPAMIETGKATELPGLEMGRYGIDIARMGVDKSVIYRNRGGQIRYVDSWAMTDTMQTTGRIKNHLDKHNKIRIPPSVIDIIGVGAGVYDRLKEMGYTAIPFQGSERAHRPDKFKNRRAEMWWGFRVALEAGIIDIDPADEDLHAQLQSVKWMVDSSGRIQIESKDDVRDRGLPSPDKADAAIYSCVQTPPLVRAQLPGSLASDLVTARI